jgi:hypothetical protein
MSRSSQRRGHANIPARTATRVNNAVMTAAASALAKNPVTAGNPEKSIWNKRSHHESHQLLF